jgi:fumarate hydratase class I
MADFAFTEILPLGDDSTPYTKLTGDHVSTFTAGGRTFLEVAPAALTLLTSTAMRDIAHLLRPGHLAQLRTILDDPEASANDRFVALDLLKNANIAAGGVLPMCQDTGTAIVMGKKGQLVVTGGGDEEAIARGIFDTYQTSNLRYSQLAPLDMYKEVNTGTNLPAQIELYATDGDEYRFLFMAKGGGSANKSYLYQETKAVLNPKSLLAFVESKLRSLGTAACPPYHLAVVIGGTSAEYTLKVAKLASARYLDTCPPPAQARPRVPRHRPRGRDLPARRSAPASARSSAASTSATTCGSSACRATARRARSASRCRARPTARPRARSPRPACSSRRSSATPRTTCPSRATRSWAASA